MFVPLRKIGTTSPPGFRTRYEVLRQPLPREFRNTRLVLFPGTFLLRMPARQKPSEFGLDTQLDTDTLKLLLSFVRPNASKVQKRHDDTTTRHDTKQNKTETDS